MPATSKNVLANSFKGFESLFTQWRMFVKMTFMILFFLVAVHLIILILILKFNPGAYFNGFAGNDLCIFRTYSIMDIRYRLIPFSKDFSFPYTCENARMIVQFDHFQAIFKQYYDSKLFPIFRRNFSRVIIIPCQIYWIYILLLFLLSKKHLQSTKDNFLRGKIKVEENNFLNLLAPFDSGLKIFLNSSIYVPDAVQVKHNFAVGATGSGKSQLAFRIVDQLVKNNIRCIIHDFKGDFIPVFYDAAKHYIFNPLDVRHMGLSDCDSNAPKGWTVFNELQTMPNVDAFASSMIPDGPGEQIWYTAPRDLFKAMIIYCIKNGLTTNADLNNMIETSPDKLRDLFEKTQGCKVGLKHLEEGKLAGQFMSILATYTASMSYLVNTDGDFSIRDWISHPNSDKRIIFLANQAEVQKTLKTLISTFFDFSTKALCSLADDPDGRRIYFILDEFGQLSKMDSVIQLLTQGRSKGAATWVFIQDIGQIDHIYGRDLSKSIVNGCRNKYYFNVSDHNTADFISKQIGTQEFLRTKESKSFGVQDMRDSISIQDEIVERPIALASEISSQENLTFFMQLSDIPQITQVKIDYRKYPASSPAYVPRDFRVSTYAEKPQSDRNESAQSIPHNPQAIDEPSTEEERRVDQALALFQELANKPAESEETSVDACDIPDLTGARFVPISEYEERKVNSQDESGDQITVYQERVNF